MASSFKFYVGANLKEVVFKDIVVRDENFKLKDVDGNEYSAVIPSSEEDLTVPNGFWIKLFPGEGEADDEAELYFGEVKVLRFNLTSGNLIYGIGNLETVPIEKGGTGATNVEGARAALGLGTAAVVNVGTTEGTVPLLGTGGTIPAEMLPAISGVPVGSVIQTLAPAGHNIGELEVPSGYLYADGSLLLRSEYPELFEAIGDAYGVGDGETTFRIPDLRGYFLRNIDGGSGRIGLNVGEDEAGVGAAFSDRAKVNDAFLRGILGISTDVNTGAVAEDVNASRVFMPGAATVALPISGGVLFWKNITFATSSGVETRPKNMLVLPLIKFV